MPNQKCLTSGDRQLLHQLFDKILDKVEGTADDPRGEFNHGIFNLSIQEAGDGRSRVGQCCIGGRVMSTLPSSTVNEVAKNLIRQLQ